MIHKHRGRYAEAEQSLKQCLAMDNRYAPAYRELAGVFDSLGKLAAAEECYRFWLQLDPQNPRAKEALASVCDRQSKLPDAERLYRALLAEDPLNLKLRGALGSVLKRSKRDAEGEAQLQIVKQYEARDVVALVAMAEQVQRQPPPRPENLDDAVACFRLAAQLVPKNASIHNNLGCLLQQQGKLDESYKAFESAVQADSSNTVARNNLQNVRRLLFIQRSSQPGQ
ncbi:MAG: tetratricopeptide repeat protein [Candidatus Riflebacteria bacterium]|nr:tetratricopeptide repeat protein [Candidatus Riflebacteria bacterium]